MVYCSTRKEEKEAMYKQKIGISVGNNYSIPTMDVIKLLKEIGFDAISPEWKEDAKIGELVKKAREHGRGRISL